MERSVVEVELANGVVALVQVRSCSHMVARARPGPLDKFDLGAVAGTLEGLSTTIRTALTKAAPDKVTVEFGLQLAVTSGT